MMLDAGTRARVRMALREAARLHLYDPNVTMVDFGHPHRQGLLREDEISIRVHVRHKLAGARLEAAVRNRHTAPIAQTIAGIPTDVTEGRYRPHWVFPPLTSGAPASGTWRRMPGGGTAAGAGRAARADPIHGGMSISDLAHFACGTLGALVHDRANGAPMLISNWHVLVNNWAARAGMPIVQPGRLDGGQAGDAIASVTRDTMALGLDAAVAALTNVRPLLADQFDLGPVRGVSVGDLGTNVMKSGRGSGTTSGRVLGVEGMARLTYLGVDRVIRHCVTIEPASGGGQVSAAGDSGALWLDAGTRCAVGLHFAGSDQPERALAMDIGTVLDALGVDLATH